MQAHIALFYYVVGGLTFLPLVFVSGLVWFILFAEREQPQLPAATQDNAAKARYLADEDEGDISPERKAAALELAVRNRQRERAAGDDDADDDLVKGSHRSRVDSQMVPGAARRLAGGGTAQNTAGPTMPKAHRSGWLVVRRQFDTNPAPLGVVAGTAAAAGNAATAGANTTTNGATTISKAPGAHLPAANAPPGTVPSNQQQHSSKRKPDAPSSGYVSAMYRGILDYRANRRQQQQHQDDGSSPRDSQIPRSNTAPQSQAATTPAQDTYFCILKSPILYLYSSADVENPTTELISAIDLRGKRVSIYVNGMGDVEGEPGEESAGGHHAANSSSDESDNETSRAANIASRWKQAKRLAIKDGELFQKRNAIRILSTKSAQDDTADRKTPQEWFIFLRSATLVEDWYHALVHASLMPKIADAPQPDLTGPVFDLADMQSLLDSLDSLPDPIPLRWLNAIVGRIFFSIYRTAWLEDYVTRKLMKKISRVRTPGFLSDIRVKEVHLGSTPPAFSRPMLKSLTGQGEASMEVGVHYTGAMRLTISTVLTISLGSRFKHYNVPLVLAVVLTSLEGNLLLQIKPPPSNRIWYGFTSLPKMDIDVEPVVSERKVQWSMVKRLIEGRIKELMTESMVVPNMDDIPFYDTRPNARRGGIWAEAAVRKEDGKVATTVAEEVRTKLSGKKSSESLREAKTPGSKKSSESVRAQSVRDGETNSTATSRADTTGTIRNRKTPAVDDPNLTPAMVGLSALLAKSGTSTDAASVRSMPATATTTNSDAHSPTQKRRGWPFVRNGTAVPGSTQAGGSTTRHNAHDRRGAPQSSLAWGSASVQLPGQDQRHGGAQGQGQTHMAAAGPGNEPPPSVQLPEQPLSDVQSSDPLDTQATPLGHAKNKESISSIRTDDSTATADTDTVQAALEDSVHLDEQQAGDGLDAEEDDVETPQPTVDAFAPGVLPSVETPAVVLHPTDGDSDSAVESATDAASVSSDPVPIFSASPASSASALHLPLSADASYAPSRRVSQGSSEGPGEAAETPTSEESARAPLPIPAPMAVPPTRTAGHGFAPPPRRSMGGVAPPISGGTLAVSPEQASTYSGSPSGSSSRDSLSRMASRGSSPASSLRGLNSAATQAALVAGWNKAKTSMADKESRQAAAKEAKDAFKRGWATFNSKRGAGGAARERENVGAGVQQEWDRLSEQSQSQSQSQSSSSSNLSWLANTTSTTDPASLGAGFGFEMSPSGSPEWQREMSAGAGGRASPGYREYRAARSREATATATPDLTTPRATKISSGRAGDAAREDGASTTPQTSTAHDDVVTPRPGDAGEKEQPDVESALPPTVPPKVSEATVEEQSTPTPTADTATDRAQQANAHTQHESSNSTPDPPTASEATTSTAPATSPPDSSQPRRPSSTSSRRTSSSNSTNTLNNTARRPSSGSASAASQRIRSQPGQRTMMAIPGIQRDRRDNEPQSFGTSSPEMTTAATMTTTQSPPGSTSPFKMMLPLPSLRFGEGEGQADQERGEGVDGK